MWKSSGNQGKIMLPWSYFPILFKSFQTAIKWFVYHQIANRLLFGMRRRQILLNSRSNIYLKFNIVILINRIIEFVSQSYFVIFFCLVPVTVGGLSPLRLRSSCYLRLLLFCYSFDACFFCVSALCSKPKSLTEIGCHGNTL